MDLALNLSDQIVTLTDGREVKAVRQGQTFVFDVHSIPTRAEFLETHRLLLAQSLALTGNWRTNYEYVGAG